MKLIVTSEFEKPKPMKPSVYTDELDFSKYVDVIPPVATSIAEKVCSLQKTYLEGSWGDHTPGQKLVTQLDMANMFDALVKATRFYVAEVQGVDIKEYKDPAVKEVAGTIDAFVKPNLAANIGGHFDRDTLVDAVVLRICGNDAWAVAWNEFMVELVFNDPYSKGINPAYYQGGSTAADKIARAIAGVQLMPDIDLSKVVTQMRSEEKAFVAPVGLKSMAKEFMSVQPMTKDGAVPTKMKFSTPKNKSIITLKDIYCAGKWKGHEPGQKLITVVDFANMFEFLTRATLYYVTQVQGVTVNEYKAAVTNSVARTVETCIKPYAVTGNIIGHFYRNALVDAVVLRACGNDAWKVAWGEFMDGLTSIRTHPNNLLVKCDEANNPPKDVEQGKLNVDVVVSEHTAEHIELDFVLLPNGKKVEVGSDNQPVPCEPPKPKPVVMIKVPTVNVNTGKPVAAPGPGWWIGDDLCWYPPLDKEGDVVKSDLLGLVTALDHPSAMVEELKQAAMTKMSDEQAEKLAIDLVTHGQVVIDKKTGEFVTDRPKDPIYHPSIYQPLYTTPPIIPVDLQKKMGISIGGHGTIGPGGEVEGFKVDSVWPVTSPNPIAKSAPCAPTPIDDVTSGFKVGDVWYNSSGGILYRCASCTVGNSVWYVIGKVTPTHEGPKIILSGKPQHIVDLEQQEIDGMKAKLLAKPAGVTYDDHSDDGLQTHWPPGAEDDLVQAMIKKDVYKEMGKASMAGFDVPLGHVNKNGNVYGKSAVAYGMSDFAAVQTMLNHVTKIPPQLLQGPVLDTK